MEIHMRLRRYSFIETPRGGITLFCQVVTVIFIIWYNLCLLSFYYGTAILIHLS